MTMTRATTTETRQPTTATTEAPPSPADPGRRRGPRLLAPLRRFQASFRARVLAGYVGLLAVATFAAIFVAREALAGGLNERIDSELVQESRELRQLATGNDPETGEPFDDRVRRIFEVYLSRNIPSRNEVLLTFVDGEPFLRSGRTLAYRLDQDRELVDRWGGLERSDRGGVDTPAGRVEYLAVPLVRGGETRGVFVAAIFRDRESGEVDDALRVVAGVGLAMLLVGSVLAWLLADRVLRPVTAVTKTARQISGGDLSRRIPVSGHDEIAVLASTFNDMLARLQTAFETQRRFVDDAGHELRTPLTIVRGHLELLEDDPVERRATLELVLDELDRMGRLVNDMLTLAKWERPDFLSTAPVEVGVLTDDVLAKAQALGDRTWVLDARATGTILADRQRVTQALVQLAQNAVQHTEKGDEIGLGAFVGDGEARLWVRDTGPGIPFEEQERVFARFYRLSGGRGSEGAGLGLSIVQAIAGAHGGRLELASVPGSGATFTVVLPLGGPGAQEGGRG
ncbi:MAG TPA: HAMP domain-containing sensor histidine kinase [Gaiellaceae bacterium]|nr:HAMP domain-containing sensor histidine kinase [Gaiellaceae bacterium]